MDNKKEWWLDKSCILDVESEIYKFTSESDISYDNLPVTITHVSINEKTRISKCYLPGWIDGIQYIKDEYMLGVSYRDKKNPDQYIDTQFAITGRAKIGELSIDAIRREMCEELGIIPNDKSSIKKIGEKIVKGRGLHNKIIDTYIISASKCRSYDICVDTDLVSNKEKDDYNMQVQIFIIGTIDEIKMLISSITHLFGKNDDDIFGPAIIKVRDIKENFERLILK